MWSVGPVEKIGSRCVPGMFSSGGGPGLGWKKPGRLARRKISCSNIPLGGIVAAGLHLLETLSLPSCSLHSRSGFPREFGL